MSTPRGPGPRHAFLAWWGGGCGAKQRLPQRNAASAATSVLGGWNEASLPGRLLCSRMDVRAAVFGGFAIYLAFSLGTRAFQPQNATPTKTRPPADIPF